MYASIYISYCTLSLISYSLSFFCLFHFVSHSIFAYSIAKFSLFYLITDFLFVSLYGFLTFVHTLHVFHYKYYSMTQLVLKNKLVYKIKIRKITSENKTTKQQFVVDQYIKLILDCFLDDMRKRGLKQDHMHEDDIKHNFSPNKVLKHNMKIFKIFLCFQIKK